MLNILTAKNWYGIILAAVLAVISMYLGGLLPTIGGPVFAILIGMVLRNTINISPIFNDGLRFSSKTILQWSIIFLGFGLSFGQVVSTGVDSLLITITTILAAFIATAVFGRLLGVGDKIRSLIGAGTAICGGSAIAAVAPIIKPKDNDIALAISTIFLFNVVAVLVFPALGHAFDMTDIGFGLWAGTAINDTSSVVAAAYSYSQEAGDYATIVKLTRATFIIPICIFYVVMQIISHKDNKQKLSLTKLIPWFIVWFVCASLIRSTGVLPADVLSFLNYLARFLMVLALAAVGLSSNLRSLASTGWQPITLGLIAWIAVATTSLLVQKLTGVW